MREQAQRQTTWFRKFGGVCQSLVGEHVPPGMLADAWNYELTPAGELAPRNGAVRRYANAAPDGKPVRSGCSANMNGIIHDVVATSAHVYSVSKAGVWTELYLLPSDPSELNPPVTFAVINAATSPMVVFGNGSHVMRWWNGTAVFACQSTNDDGVPVPEEAAPMGRPINYKGYLAVFGMPTDPNKVQFNFFSNGISSPDRWLATSTDANGNNVAASNTERYLVCCGPITSIYSFAGLIMFTLDRTQLFSGDPDNPIGVTDLSTTTGCVSHESVCDCDGIVVWKSVTCLPCWNGGGQFPTDDLDVPLDPTQSNIVRDTSQLDSAKLSSVCGTWIPEKKVYIFSANILRHGTNKRTSWVYYFKWKAWFPWSLPATSFTVRTYPGHTQEILVGTESGAILTLDATASHVIGRSAVRVEDDGVAYAAWAETGDMDMGHPDNEKTFRGFIVGCRGVGLRRFSVRYGGDFGIAGQASAVVASILGYMNAPALSDGSEPAGQIGASMDPGGFVAGNSTVGSKFGDILSPSRPYLEERVPMVLRAKHIRLRFDNPIPATGELKNIAMVPIASYAIEWKLGAIRRQLIGKKSPVARFAKA